LKARTNKRQPKLRKGRLFFLIFLLLLFILGCYYFLSLPIWSITNISVNGAKILLPDEIKTLAAVPPGSNLFFTSLKRTRANLKKISAIKSFSVYRIPPGTLLINISEREPLATMVFSKKSVIIDKDGYILNNNPNITLDIPNLVDLPVITGFGGMNSREADRVDEQSAQIAWDIITKLAKFFKAKSIKLNLGGMENMSFLLDDILLVKLGNAEEIDKKMRVFEALLPQIENQWQQVEYVDVRFVNNPVIKFK